MMNLQINKFTEYLKVNIYSFSKKNKIISRNIEKNHIISAYVLLCLSLP